MSVVLSIDRARVDPPAVLPVDYLSLTSIKAFAVCPERWRRRYIEHEPEPVGGGLILGGAAHKALANHYGYVIERGEGVTLEQLLDEYSAAWDDRVEHEEVVWGDERPGPLKDEGAGCLKVYHRRVAPIIAPVAVERDFELSWPGVEWKLTGVIDLETAGGAIVDHKFLKRRMSKADADADLQPTIYCADRRAEGDPAVRFDFHQLVRNKTPVADVLTTYRTDAELDLLTERIFRIAVDIDWRCQTGNWTGAAPGNFLGCGICRYANCPLRLGRLQ